MSAPRVAFEEVDWKRWNLLVRDPNGKVRVGTTAQEATDLLLPPGDIEEGEKWTVTSKWIPALW